MYFNNMFNNFFPFRNSYSFRPQNSQQSSYQDPRIIMSQKILSDKSNFYCFDCGRQLNDLNYFDLKMQFSYVIIALYNIKNILKK